MSVQRLYLDHAATSFPKPPEVTAAMVRWATECGASAGRGAYAEAQEAGKIVSDCREMIATLLGAPSPQTIAFTANCSDALNIALKGLIDPNDARGKGHVLCTQTDHNSVLRPIHAMADAGWIEFDIVPVDATGRLDPAEVKSRLRRNTRYVAITHGSNVTGCVQDIDTIGKLCREHAVPMILDAAQTVGHLPIDVLAQPIDLLCAPGHKGLMGPLGTGFLYVRPGMEKHLRGLRQGGTGSRSDEPRQPNVMPDKLEAGSHNMPGLAGLLAACQWVAGQTIERLASHGQALVRTFIDNVSNVPGLRYFGPQGVAGRLGVFSVEVDGLSPAELANVLEREFGLQMRTGIHCAPLVHAAIGSADHGGTARVSFGPLLSTRDVKYAADALAQVAERRQADVLQRT